MVNQCIASLSLDLLHFLSSWFDEFHEFVNATDPDTNWEVQVEKLVQIIREDRKKGVESESGLISGPTESRVL